MSNEVNLVGTPNEWNGQLKSIVVKLIENYVGFTTLEAVVPIAVTPLATIPMDENAAAYVGDVAM